MKDSSEAMTMTEAIEMLKTTRPTFYRWLRDGKIKGMKVGRQWRFYREDLERFMGGEEPRVDLPANISPLLKFLEERLLEKGVGLGEAEEDEDLATAAVKRMIRLAYFSGASDLHLQAGEKEGLLRLRIGGRLQELTRIDRRLVAPLVDRWKSLASCDLNEKNRPQDGRLLLELGSGADEAEAKSVDVRVCFVPSFSGECLTARLLDTSHGMIQLDQIDFDAADRAKLDRVLAKGRGLVVVTGPAGCGKTSTLYACMNAMRVPENMLMSIEDPISFTLPDVVQIRVRPQHGVTFAPALRAMLRSDPDVILVGEVRGRDTVEVFLQGVLNGHMILTALHAEDAVSALSRLSSLCEHPQVLSDTLELIVAQRLVRCVCPECSQPCEPEAFLEDAKREIARAGLNWSDLNANFVRGEGCAACGGLGYRGRTVIAEVLEMTPALRQAQRSGAGEEELNKIVLEGGMSTMAIDGIRKAAAGKTTLEEVARVLGLSWWK